MWNALRLRRLRIDIVRQDLRYGVRQLLRDVRFTAIAVTTLALGIGATTAIFTVASSVLFRELPYREPRHLVQMATTLDEARREMAAHAQQIASEHSEQYPAERGHAVTVVSLHDEVTGRASFLPCEPRAWTRCSPSGTISRSAPANMGFPLRLGA